MAISPLIRQLFVIWTCQLSAFSSGGAVSFPTVLLQQCKDEKSSIKLTLSSSSWIGAIHGLGGIFSILIPIFMQWQGRKAAIILGCATIFLGWVLVYTASNITTILISECLHGFGTNSAFAVSLLSITEMTSPKHRIVATQSYAVIQSLGMAISVVLSKFLHWKNICAIMSIPIVLALLIALTWPESPYWLACKGRFGECEKSFRQLRSMDAFAKKELDELIAAQKENLSNRNKEKISLATYWAKIKRRDFYLPSIHIFLLLTLVYWSGCLVTVIYSFEMIEKTTHSSDASYYGGIAINFILCGCIAISSLLSKLYDNKIMLLISNVCATGCLFGVSAVSLLQSFQYVSEDSLICLFLLIAFIIVSSLGMWPLAFSIVSELMPVKHRGIGGAFYIIFNCMLYASSLKIFPYMLLYLNLWGTFLLYTLNSIVCGLLIWNFVPETKNRTLQQIEDFYNHGKFLQNHIDCDACEPING